MRLFLVLLPALALAQEADVRIELTASVWRAGISGTVRAGGVPVKLHGDLNLQDRWTFFGKLLFKPARRQRILVEGSPYGFTGVNTLSRTIRYNGHTYAFSDTIASEASLTYFFAGYEYELMHVSRGHFGLEAGGAYLDATGTIRGLTTGITATRGETIGLPLAGAGFRVYFGPARLNVNGDAKGMSLGRFGDYFEGGMNLGAGFRRFMFQAGYQYLNANIHENRAANPAGIRPVIGGPVFSIQCGLP